MGDRAYEWSIRKRPTYDQEIFRGAMHLVVQAADPRGRCMLVVDLGIDRPDNLVSPHGTMITPAMVRRIIGAAIEAGWEGNGGGGVFHYRHQVIKT